MADRCARGLLDTSVVIDLDALPEAALPEFSTVSAVTLAELSEGPHIASNALERIRRLEFLQAIESRFPSPLSFDATAARRFGSMVALVIAAGRSPRPRRMDLMIGATAATHGLPLFTRKGEDFKGLEGVLSVVSV